MIRAGQRDRADRASQADQANPADQVWPVHPVASAEPASRGQLRHGGRQEAGPDLPLRDATNTGTCDPRTVPLEPTTPGAASPVLAPLAAPRTHLVRSRETLWSIAQDELGSALRWNELAELNYGITQMDGRALDEEHWVMPGWRLLLPPVGTPTGPVTRSVAPPESAHRSSGLVGGGVARAVGSGLRRALTPEPSSGPAHRVDSGPGSVGGGGPEPEQMPVPPVAPLGAGVVGAGVIRLLDLLRRVQQRYRPEGTYIRLPDADLSEFEQRLRIGDGWVVPLEVDSAVRQVAQSLSETGERPQVLGVRVHEDVIEMVMADTGRPMEVTDRSTTASTVSTARRVAGRLGLEGAAAPGPRALAPMLVTVGRDVSGPVMVNLEALGSLVVSGNQAEADAVVRALALELSTSFWAGQFSLAVVGFGSELERFQGVRSYPVGTELIDSLYRRRLNGADLLRTAGYASFAQARLAEDSDRWSPLAVICGPAVPDADVAEILEAATDPVHGTTVVAVGHRNEAQYSVRLTGGGWASSLELLGSVAFPQRIEADELGKVSALLDTATSRQSVLSSEEPYVSLPIQLPRTGNGSPVLTSPIGPDPHGTSDSHRPTSRASTASAAHTSVGGAGATSPEVEVAVLGPIEIRGAARSFSRAWAEELVVYLAMHPNGASNEAWATALWPDRLMAPSSLHSTASVARRSLGPSTKGTDHLPRSHGRLVLAPTVGTDWDRFVALSESDRPEQWRAAMTLVRGRPFEGLRCSDWPILEGIAPAIEAAVVDLSGRLAGACLQLRDAQGAEWAARRGLVVSPYDERLYRMLMRAADAGGNPAGVDALMSELLALVADGIEPIDAVHPETMELYRQLSRRGRYRTPGSEEAGGPECRVGQARRWCLQHQLGHRLQGVGATGHQQGCGDGLPPPFEVVPDLLLGPDECGVLDERGGDGGDGLVPVAGEVQLLDLGGLGFVPHAGVHVEVEVHRLGPHATDVQGDRRSHHVGRPLDVVVDDGRGEGDDFEVVGGVASSGTSEPLGQCRLERLDRIGGEEDGEPPVCDLGGQGHVLRSLRPQDDRDLRREAGARWASAACRGRSRPDRAAGSGDRRWSPRPHGPPPDGRCPRTRGSGPAASRRTGRTNPRPPGDRTPRDPGRSGPRKDGRG